MIKILNIVNGKQTAKTMKKAQINGDFLPWNDFLHEGPVPPNLSLDQLSEIRINFIHKQGFNFLEQIREEFHQRNSALRNHHQYQKIILWFEHDLYDQLQLLQVLAWLNNSKNEYTQVSIISKKYYIGEYSSNEILKLLCHEKPITDQHLTLAQKAWSAFQEPTPLAWYRLLHQDTSLLPFLKKSIKRMLEEFPNVHNGLSRSSYQALKIISEGISDPKEIFIKAQVSEREKFMGNLIFWKILDDFIEHSLITSQQNGQILTITKRGKKVLNGTLNYMYFKETNQWIGGTKLSNDNVWCWNSQTEEIKKYYYSKPLSSLLSFI